MTRPWVSTAYGISAPDGYPLAGPDDATVHTVPYFWFCIRVRTDSAAVGRGALASFSASFSLCCCMVKALQATAREHSARLCRPNARNLATGLHKTVLADMGASTRQTLMRRGEARARQGLRLLPKVRCSVRCPTFAKHIRARASHATRTRPKRAARTSPGWRCGGKGPHGRLPSRPPGSSRNPDRLVAPRWSSVPAAPARAASPANEEREGQR